MASDRNVLYFTVGPVQGFVAQARRTRDLWAGSLLLSALSAHAMAPVIESASVNEGTGLVRPAVALGSDTPAGGLLSAVQEIRAGHTPVSNPTLGSLPNAFKAIVPNDFDPRACDEALQEAWRRVAEAVWTRFVAGSARLGSSTQAIWQRQVDGFWETSWVLVSEEDAAAEEGWLARRKNWRTHMHAPEPGDKCTLMGNLQELSGYSRAAGQTERSKQDTFWASVRRAKGVYDLDLADGERLSAVALIKRLYPRIGEAALGWDLQEAAFWPSTTAIATRPWVKRARSVAPEKCEDVAKAFRQGVDGDRGGPFREFAGRHADDFERLDSRLYFRDRLGNADVNWTDSEACKTAGEALKRLQGVTGIGRPSNYYALLVMDGDRLGQLLSTRSMTEADISSALDRFTAQVTDIIEAADGVTVYAGGDDVLALLPVPQAIRAARELREAYGTAFDGNRLATASTALLIASDGVPLRTVLETARHLLDEVAKERNGRDSLVVRSLDGNEGGIEWVSTWHDEQGRFVTEALEKLAAELSKDTDSDLSRNFGHKLQDRYSTLANDAGELMVDLTSTELLDIIKAELARSDRDRDPASDDAEATRLGELLVYLGRRRCRKVASRGADPKLDEDDHSLSASAPLLARFLVRAQEGVER